MAVAYPPRRYDFESLRLAYNKCLYCGMPNVSPGSCRTCGAPVQYVAYDIRPTPVEVPEPFPLRRSQLGQQSA